jgi:hypothetical protein
MSGNFNESLHHLIVGHLSLLGASLLLSSSIIGSCSGRVSSGAGSWLHILEPLQFEVMLFLFKLILSLDKLLGLFLSFSVFWLVHYLALLLLLKMLQKVQ